MAFLQARAGMALGGDIDDYPDGIVIPVDKPYRWTSADVIRKVKWAACGHFHKKNLKVGHAGTLDPLATGVLLVCVGKATKLADDFQRHDKEYLADVMFGATTPSYDREKEIDRTWPVEGICEESLREVLAGFAGEQEQVAPLFSAKSVDGVRAYEMARKAYKTALREGREFDHCEAGLLSRQHINISGIDLVSFFPARGAETSPGMDGGGEGKEPARQDGMEEAFRPNPRINVIDTSTLGLPHATISVRCSKGTYIRSLARDIGEALGSGAFLNSLRRTRSGPFHVGDCLSLGQTMNLLAGR